MINKIMTILYVNDQEVAKEFYLGVLGTEPILDVPGMTEFQLQKNSSLGLMPLQGAKQLLGNHRFKDHSTSSLKAELYLIVEDAQAYLDRANKNGSEIIMKLAIRDWGDRVGYCLDPDGHVLAFAEEG